MTSLYRPVLEPLGLTYPQYVVMLVLWRRGEASVGELGEALALDSGTLSPLLKRLEAQGYVRRGRSPRDERVVLVTPTPAGLALHDTLRDLPERLGCALDLDGTDLGQLQSLLSRVRAAAAVAAL
ncbi:MarR family transcriptional regulator [Motilibacter sp. E257]|uniref:MarR family transcriptional regulator n=2 Tax=Motilibacter deserti TaxID=2714956 RepID=A0ABX0GVH5_9ACTN|nr:MarR family transcriptional regulator [Motilibacter deserti]NHC14952.1 MarR family transcriptional regulator [Motilibacter deserti]